MPVDAPFWTFRETQPGYTKRGAFEGEFFKGEGDSAELNGRTDSLVREVIQNSLDARDASQDGPVHVRFAFSAQAALLDSPSNAVYLDGLSQHLAAMGNDHLAAAGAYPPLPFLLIEDFHTRGLCGEPERDDDPDKSAGEQSFYWFWRNVGRSGKYGSQRGRWGLGKSVFPSASRINAFFGLTVRSSDGRTLLMGQAITKVHQFEGKSYVSEGYFHDPSQVGQIQMPFEAPAEIVTRFKNDFGIKRTVESGLSVVVPYPLDVYKPENVLRSVIVHFFIPVLRRQLIVDVIFPDGTTTKLERSTIRAIADSIGWATSGVEKHHTRPPFTLAAWAIARQDAGDLEELRPAGTTTAPQWSLDLFSDGQLDRLREKFAKGERIAVRAPLSLEMKDGTLRNTYFEAFLERDADVTHGEDHFVREGMTIAKVTTLRTQKGVRGLVLVNDSTLSSFLGDAEGPAHTEWSENEDRPNDNYKRWVWRLRFVKHSLRKLVEYLTPPPEGLDVDLLQDIFSIDEPAKPGATKGKRKKPKNGDETPEPPDLPPTQPPKLQVSRLEREHGFRITGTEALSQFPVRLRVRAAYDVPSGNPHSRKNYSPFDFVFDEGKRESVKLICEGGVKILARKADAFVIEATAADFSVEAAGFDPLRDLVVDSKVLEQEDAEESSAPNV